RRFRTNAFGLVQQLTDVDNGKVVSWPLPSGRTLTATGRLFDSILVVPEPVPGRLLEHQRFVGELLEVLASPLGALLFGKAVDQVHVHNSRGPHGQRKLFDLLGMASIDATAYDDPRGF